MRSYSQSSLATKHLKPFVSRLQLKMSSSKVLALAESDTISFDVFAKAIRQLIYAEVRSIIHQRLLPNRT